MIYNMELEEPLQTKGYIGEVQQLVREGYGVYVYENKFFRYEGEWLNGKKHGHGKFVMADGSYYEGEFEHGEISGNGFRFYALTGNTYCGEFCMGEQNRQEVMRYSDGSEYEGEWCGNKRQGCGILRSQSGAVYNGYFYDHMRHGEGLQIYSDGSRYEGNWVMDRRQGHGVMIYTDESKYEGQWRSEMRNGEGVLYHRSGMVYEGLWINDLPATMPVKLVIVPESLPLHILPGQQFSVEVECQNEFGIQCLLDVGREIQLSAGVKCESESAEENPKPASPTPFPVIPICPIIIHDSGTIVDSQPSHTSQVSNASLKMKKSGSSNQTNNNNNNSRMDVVRSPTPVKTEKEDQPGESESRCSVRTVDLFKLIEDEDYVPIPTSLGFNIIRYPLVDVLAQSEPTIGCCSPHETESEEEMETVELSISQTTQKSLMLSTVSDPASKPAKKRSNKAADNASQPAKLLQKSTTEINKATSKLSQKSTTEINKATSKLSQKSTTEINKSKDKKDKIKDSEDELMPGCDPLAHCLESKPTVGDNMSVASSDKTTLPTSTRTTRQGKVVFERLRIPPPPPGYRPFLKKSLSESVVVWDNPAADEKVARTGEYVLMATDVTHPPFLDYYLEPGFLVLTVVDALSSTDVKASTSVISKKESSLSKQESSLSKQQSNLSKKESSLSKKDSGPKSLAV